MTTLKDLRTAAGLSQTELANASGVSIEAIKKIESGKVERPHPATLRLLAAVLGQVPVVMNGSRNGPVFDPGMFDNARREEAPCVRIVPDPGSGIPEGFVPLRMTTLSGSIVGPLAQLSLTQRFAYRRTECDRVIEAVYRFPLPGDAAVTSVRVRFGEVLVQTSLASREDAERQYAAARQQGRQAALATRESTDVFTLQLTGLQPDQEVIVETEFVQAASPHGVGWQLRVPLTIGPRYSRPDEAGSPSSHGQPLRVWRDPGHRFSLDLQFSESEGISSPSHRLRVWSDADEQRVRLADESVIPDRDLVMDWLPVRQPSQPTLKVLTHEDLEEGMRYFLALITPPATASATIDGVDREITLLVDRSGSMQGPKWEACRWAVRRFLDGLTPNDRFRLGLFQSRCDWMSAAPLAGTAANCQRAVAFVDGHDPEGGTELGPALEQALRAPVTRGDYARHVLMFTDGEVSDDARILQLVEGESERSAGRRLSVISIDAAPRSAFVRALAEAGGGEAVFLSSDPHQEDIASALDRVLDTWARPLATDLELSVATSASNVSARHATGRTQSRIRLGDLPAGRSLWVSGAMTLFAEPVFELRAGSPIQMLAEHALDLDAAPPPRPAIRALFGARQIARLERLEAQALDAEARDALLDELGYANDPLRAARPRAVYAENARTEGTIVHQLLVRESLRFGLVCSATAFVGERVEAGRRITASVEIPSALAAGSIEQSTIFLSRRAPAPAMARSVPGGPARFSMMERTVRAAPRLRFQGLPPTGGVESVLLFEGRADIDVHARLSRLAASVRNKDAIDGEIELWICVDDPTSPRVRTLLRELLAFGERPLNVAVQPGALIQVYLHGAWPPQAGELRVELS